MKRLIKFFVPVRRSADLIAYHVVDGEEWDAIQGAIATGKTIHFGEVAGKHSDVSIRLGAEHITVLSEDQTEIATVERLLGTDFGPISLLGAMANDEEG